MKAGRQPSRRRTRGAVSRRVVVGSLVAAVLASAGGVLWYTSGTSYDDPPPGKMWWVVFVSDGTGCGGVIVKENWVLTAGHCVLLASSNNPVAVYAGRRKARTGLPLGVSEVHFAPGYSRQIGDKANDLALLKVDQLTLGQKAVAITIASVSDETGVNNGAVAAWGCGSPQDVSGSCDYMVYREVDIESFTECGGTNTNFICTEHAVDPHDSGSSLSTGIEPCAKLLGIAAEAGSRDDFTRVSQFATWIDTTVGGLPAPPAGC